MPGASGVIVLDGDDVVLTEQMRFAVDRVMVEIVKGGADEGETTQACAERELREELGLEAARWTPLGPAYEVPSILTAPVELYLARDVRPVAPLPTRSRRSARGGCRSPRRSNSPSAAASTTG